MTRKQIEAARETRLWLSQVVLPTVTAVVTIVTIPEVREAIVSKAKAIKQQIESEFQTKD